VPRGGASRAAGAAVACPRGSDGARDCPPSGPAVTPLAPAADPLLEAAQFALVAHFLSTDVDRDVAQDVATYGTLVAIELGISAELRAAGRLTEARNLRDHAYARALTLERLAPMRATVPSTWSMITDPPGGWILVPPEEAARAMAAVDVLSERALRDVAPIDAPTIDAVVAAVERYTTPLDDEGR
jgi:hypothetical protein